MRLALLSRDGGTPARVTAGQFGAGTPSLGATRIVAYRQPGTGGKSPLLRRGHDAPEAGLRDTPA